MNLLAVAALVWTGLSIVSAALFAAIARLSRTEPGVLPEPTGVDGWSEERIEDEFMGIVADCEWLDS